MAVTDLELAYRALSEKAPIYDRLWHYYDGNQPLRYSTDRLKEVFRTINARFTQNWCEVVVETVLERLNLTQFVVHNNATASKQLTDWFETSEMHLDADDVELCAMVTGESFVIIWPTEQGDELEAFYNDSRLCHVIYQAESPRQMRMAAKWWIEDAETADGRGKIRLTLYYPDRLEYYISNKLAKDVREAKQFEPFPVEGGLGEYGNHAPNPFGTIPVFHFRRERRAIKSELAPSVLDVQDAINKLFSDMMVSAEFGAFKQRYVISQADVGVLKNAPGEIWDIPAGDGMGQDTQVGEFSETSLNNFMQSMEQLSVSIAKMTRTPQSYFFLGARSDPSGEALIAMESPLNKKCSKYIRRFGVEWQRLAAFVAQYEGIDLAGGKIRAVYEDPRTVQPFTQAQTRQTNVNAGIPLTTQLRNEGWTDAEIEQMATDRQAEAAQQESTMATALLNAQRRLNQQ